MKKSKSSLCFKLPTIISKRRDHPLTRRISEEREELADEENDVLQVSALDQWNTKNHRCNIKGSKTVTAIKSGSIVRYDLRRGSIQLSAIM